jgi:hypothetical protein
MTTLPRIRRLALLLVLLPQLLVLGLGRGVVICIASDGHVRVEAAASVCCEDGGSALGGAGLAGSPDEPDCGPCADFRLALDARAARGSSVAGWELPQSAAALPVEPPTPSAAADLARPHGLRQDRGRVPPHLVHLHCVVLRC